MKIRWEKQGSSKELLSRTPVKPGRFAEAGDRRQETKRGWPKTIWHCMVLKERTDAGWQLWKDARPSDLGTTENRSCRWVILSTVAS